MIKEKIKQFSKYGSLLLLGMLVINVLIGMLSYIPWLTFTTSSISDKIVGPAIYWQKEIIHIPMGEGKDPFKFLLVINQTLVTTWVSMLIIFFLCWFTTKNLSVENPEKKQILAESYYEGMKKYFMTNFGKYTDKYITFITALFTFILISNIISFVPVPYKRNGVYDMLFRSPTADLNTTVALALVVTFMFLREAFAKDGAWNYIKGNVLKFWNLPGEISKPLNISMRLFGNMLAGFVIMGLLYSMTPTVGKFLSKFTVHVGDESKFIIPLVWPSVLHLYFDLFSGLIQSFVFVMLTTVYISANLKDPEVT